jgi:hypothetical protein
MNMDPSKALGTKSGAEKFRLIKDWEEFRRELEKQTEPGAFDKLPAEDQDQLLFDWLQNRKRNPKAPLLKGKELLKAREEQLAEQERLLDRTPLGGRRRGGLR